MCGFFVTNNIDKLSLHDFTDVKQRGISHNTFIHDEYWSLQALLPCVTGNIDFTIYETEDYIFSFTGEIYNFDKSYITDTKYFFDNFIRGTDFLKTLNGMYAAVLYNKKDKTITATSDAIGQIPLFVYNKNGVLILSNTVKSIVLSTNTTIRRDVLDIFENSKHWISTKTPWNDIEQFPRGNVIKYASDGVIIFQEEVPVQRINKKVDIEDVFITSFANYSSPLKSASSMSGGVDSSVITKLFNQDGIGINHIEKDWVSSRLEEFKPFLKTKIDILDIDLDTWCSYTIEFMKETYLLPYSWSWIGYYIIGKHLKDKVNVIYTGEGADEIFGGYLGYSKNGPTPYSNFKSADDYQNNKLQDQQVFITVGSIGANLALGCNTIESRNPYLDNEFLYNDYWLPALGKLELKNIFIKHYNRDLLIQKQGFGGFPNEFYNYIFGTNVKHFDSNNFWKSACVHVLNNIGKY